MTCAGGALRIGPLLAPLVDEPRDDAVAVHRHAGVLRGDENVRFRAAIEPGIPPRETRRMPVQRFASCGST